MRQDFVLVRGPGVQERYPTLYALAARIHVLRGDKSLHLKVFTLGHPDGEEGPCVALKAGDDRAFPIGWALFPDTIAYAGEEGRLQLAKALLDQCPDQHRSFDGETLAFDPTSRARGKAA